MRNLLKIEEVDTPKRLLAIIIDLLITIAAAFAIIFGVFYTSFSSFSDLNSNRDYINSQEVVTEGEFKYNLNLDDGQNYEVFLDNAKQFFLKYENEIVKAYIDGLENDPNEEFRKPEFKEKVKHIEFIYNARILGLPLFPVTTDESTYKNDYFQYVVRDEKIVYDEFGIDNPRTIDFNERGIMNRRLYCYDRFQNCKDLLYRIDPQYKQAIKTNEFYRNISCFGGSLISIVIFYIIVPLCLKNNSTIGKKIFNYGYINANGTKLSWWKGLVKVLIAAPLMLFSFYTVSIVAIIIFAIGPYAINIIYFLFNKDGQDILDKILRIKLVNVKDTLIFNSQEEEDAYFKNRDETIDQEEIDYTNLLNNISSLDVRSIEEKIEDEQKRNDQQ